MSVTKKRTAWVSPVHFLFLTQVRTQTKARRERTVSENIGVQHNGQLARNDSTWVQSHEIHTHMYFRFTSALSTWPSHSIICFFLLPGVSFSPFMMLTQRGWVRTMHVYCLVSSPFSLAFVLFFAGQCMLLHVQVWPDHTCQSWLKPIWSQYKTACDVVLVNGQCSLELLCQSVSLMPWLPDSSILLYCTLMNGHSLHCGAVHTEGLYLKKLTDQSFSFNQTIVDLFWHDVFWLADLSIKVLKPTNDQHLFFFLDPNKMKTSMASATNLNVSCPSAKLSFIKLYSKFRLKRTF